MARLKAMVRSALEDRSPGFMLATIALAVAVSLVAGFAIGYKVEESRGKPAKKTATKKHTGKTAQPKPIRLKGAPLLIGGVYAVRPKQLVVLGADAKPKRIGIGPNTRVAVAEAGKSTDVVVGSHVLFQPSPRSRTKAVEVVVLPAKAPVGAAVTAVVPGKSLTIKNLKGADTVITTTGATVAKTRPGTRTNIAQGDKVVVDYFVVRGRRNAAIEVVVLPTGSKFK